MAGAREMLEEIVVIEETGSAQGITSIPGTDSLIRRFTPVLVSSGSESKRVRDRLR